MLGNYEKPKHCYPGHFPVLRKIDNPRTSSPWKYPKEDESEEDESEKIYAYKLDWTEKDKSINARHSFLVENPEVGAFEKIVQDMEFHIPEHYLKHIRHCSRRAMEESLVVPSYDTLIRERCLEVSSTFVQTAFMLLVDCSVREYGYSSFTKSLLLFKFWIGQTGRGLYSGKANIDSLEWWLGNRADPDDKTADLVREYVKYARSGRSDTPVGDKVYHGYDMMDALE